jgi:hypothetical protein
MTSKDRRACLAVLMTWPPQLIQASHDNPTRFMSASNLRLHRLALRRMGAGYAKQHTANQKTGA